MLDSSDGWRVRTMARRVLGVPVAIGLATLIAVIDLATGTNTALAGLMVVGPATAAATASARGVVAVGAYVVALILALAGPNDLWGSSQLVYFLGAAVVVTALGALTTSWRTLASMESERWADIVRSSNDAVISSRLDGTITSWNGAAEGMYGWTAEEAVGRNISIIVPQERRDELGRLHRRVAAGERVPVLLTRRVAKDGSLLDVSVSASPIRSPSGHVVGIAAIGRDVTDLLLGAAAVEQSEARKAAVLASAPDAIVTIDHLGRVLEVNATMCTTFGWTAEEMLGRELADLIVPPESRDAHREGIASYLHSGNSPMLDTRLDVTAMRKDGARIPVEVTITPVDLPGFPVFTGFLRDVSARRAAEAEAERLQARLRQADRLDSLGQLAGGVAHDFNNLLAVILNYADLVRDEVPPGRIREDVDAISTTAARAADLTRQLLTFSRGDNAVVAPVDVNAAVTRVCELLRRTLPGTILLDAKLADQAWSVQCDPTRLDQVLMNLAVNARDAMPDGGVLTMTTRNAHLDELAVRSRVALGPGRYLELTVSDTGTGMTPDVQERAFDPFFSTKSQGKGTGLGLATVYGIARQMGGEASIYSEVGVGTSLRLHLPAADAPAAADVPGPRATPLAEVVAGQRILLVEDEALLREALDRTLSAAGYVVQSATTGEEALALLREPPDVLISDVTLPAMSGPELALRMRMLTPGLPVLLMSGYAAHQLPPELAGTVLLLDKPFPARELLAHVAELLAYERSP